MELYVEQPVAVPRPSEATCWYRAASLRERLDQRPPVTPQQVPDEAQTMLQRWKEQRPFQQGPFFANRLQMDGITEQDLLALLAEPLENLQQRLSEPAAPDWIRKLVDALYHPHAPLPLPEQDQGHQEEPLPIVEPFYPLMQRSIARVQAGITALAQQYDQLPFNPATMLSLLLPDLFHQLQFLVSKTVVLELNIARLRGQLQGETPEERFKDYLRQLRQQDQLQTLLEEYVVLARQILTGSQRWAECSLEFLQRLCADWPQIVAVLAQGLEPGLLTGVAGGAGDTHRGGHSVMILTFDSGLRLLYKPKSLSIDVHFQEFLAWLNERGSHPPFRLLNLINKETYGWSEFAYAMECHTKEEVERFYERQGGYLALLYMLDATDFHHENVIAAGEHPLLVDLEALFHPRPKKGEMNPTPAQLFLEQSVMRIALLPIKVFFNEEGEGLDIGGLAHIEGQLSPRPIAQWEDKGTDEMKLVQKRVILQGSQNNPRLHGQEVQALDYLEQIISGFTTIYRLFMTYRDEVLTTILTSIAHDEVRFVARDTRTYSILLNESFHPNMLRDAFKRERLFDHLWMSVEDQPSLALLIPAERADLLGGDIPMFTTRPESCDLWTSRRECIPAFFGESSLDFVRRRIEQLRDSDLQLQLWVIRASFADMAGERTSATPAPLVLSKASSHRSSPPTHSDQRGTQLLALARTIGDRLSSTALWDGSCADWFGLTLIMERSWQITAGGLDLYSGLPGIILFLSYLGMITEEQRFTDLAQAGFNTLHTLIQKNLTALALEQIGMGAFTGLGSYLYLLVHLASLWNDSSLLKEPQNLLHLFASKVEKDEQFDVMDGSAGCIASLLNLYAVAPSEQILGLAIQCGEHLLAHAQPMPIGLGWKARQHDLPLSGFSHGAAGIAWSLLRLAAASGDERFRASALAALAYEDSLYSHDQHNWRDVRKRPATRVVLDELQAAPPQEERYGMSWSHGAPGIALGRLISLPYLDNATMRNQLERALDTTIAQGFGHHHEQVGPNHSLAHGDCGNLETILVAAHTLHTPHLHEHLERLTAQLMENVQQYGWAMGVPRNIETPGLLLGLSGMGYQCLRLAEPERIPSLLILAPPPNLLTR